MDRAPNEKAPPSGGALRHSWVPGSWAPKLLVVLTALAALLLAGTIALAHRIVLLLLLAGFLTTALLLPWLPIGALLAGILTLLTRILVLLLRHSGKLPCWTSGPR
jgi:hypothetical protein